MDKCPHGLFDVCCNDADNCTLGKPRVKKVFKVLNNEDVEQAWIKSEGAKDRLAAFYKNMDDRLKEKNT